MYKSGEAVMHGSSGICRITGIKALQFGHLPKQKYYVLVPLYEPENTIYIPVAVGDNVLRYPLTGKEIKSMIAELPAEDNEWIDNMKERKDYLTAVIRKGDPKELVGLIRMVYARDQEKRSAGKRISDADTKQMEQAEKVLHGELAYSLKIKPEEVAGWISSEIAQKRKKIKPRK